MEQVTYCKSWFAAQKRPTEIWDEAKAREAHEARQIYTVLLGNPDRPRCVLDIVNDFVGIDFLDTNLREILSYQFREVEPRKLFLSAATYREFEGETDVVKRGTDYSFSTDGAIVIRKEEFNPHNLEIAETTGDVSGNYDVFPTFGEYSSIAVDERS